MSHYRVAKYYTVVEHARIPDIQIASAVTWEVLPEEYREIILQCAAESAQYQRNLWIRNDIFARAAVIDSGCEVIFLEPEQQQAFLDAVEPLYDRYCGDYQELLQKIRES